MVEKFALKVGEDEKEGIKFIPDTFITWEITIILHKSHDKETTMSFSTNTKFLSLSLSHNAFIYNCGVYIGKLVEFFLESENGKD